MFTKVLVLIVLSPIAYAPVGAEQLGWLRGDPKITTFDSGDVSIEYPDNWQHVSSGPSPIVAIITKAPDSSITIYRETLPATLLFSESFVKYEPDDIKTLMKDSKVTGSMTRKLPNLGQVLQIDLVGSSASSGRDKPRPLRVMAISVPTGRFRYRILFTARDSEFEKQRKEVFERVLGSLKIKPPQAPVGMQ